VVGVGEVGMVQVRPDGLVVEKEVARGQPSYKWFVVSRTPGNAAVSTLAVTLVQTSKRDAFVHKSLSDKERGALRIGLKICFELHVPPALWSLHFLDSRRAVPVHVTSSRPGSSGAALAATRGDDVASRLQRFVHVDDTGNAVGCGRVTDEGRKLNASLLADYERRARAHPTTWGVALTDILFSDCLAFYGRMTEARGSQYADTQLSILNRLHAFHAAIGAAAAQQPLIQDAVTAAAAAEVARKALVRAGGVNDGGDNNDDDDDERQDDDDDRRTILRELVESERTYLKSLIALDDVFVARLTEVAQGANIKLAVSKSSDAWANKMGLVTSKPKTTTGVQVSGASPWKAIARTGSYKASESEHADDAVLDILRQPEVTVLLQSVRQIRTVNEEFLSSLSKAVADQGPVGGVLERFAGVMPVYSTYATHHPFVLEQIALSSAKDDADTRFSMGGGGGGTHKPSELEELITACEADPRCMGRGMRDLMNLPLERVETYRSVLSALLMVTPQTHPDWECMRVAMGRIVESTKSISRAVLKKENAKLLRELALAVDGWPAAFELEDSERWLVREGALVERDDDGKCKLRYFWLFSDCIVIATRLQASSLAAMVTGASAAAAAAQFKFRRVIRIKDMTLCDLPHGIQHKGAVLGDPAFAFCIACVCGPSFVAMVPNNPTECQSKAGPAPVDLARIGPPSTSRIDVDRRSRSHVVYHKANVKSAWLSDILLCIEMHQRGAVFDSDDGLKYATHGNGGELGENSGRELNARERSTRQSRKPAASPSSPPSSAATAAAAVVSPALGPGPGV